jgi:hypothetical protein
MSFRILRPRKDRSKTGWADMPLYILVLLDFAATTLTRSRIFGKFSSLSFSCLQNRSPSAIGEGAGLALSPIDARLLQPRFPTLMLSKHFPNRPPPTLHPTKHNRYYLKLTSILALSFGILYFQRYSIHFSTIHPVSLCDFDLPPPPLFSLLPNNGLFTTPLSTSYLTLPTSPTLNLQLPSSPNSHRRLPWVSSIDLITSKPIFDRLFILLHLWCPPLEVFIYIATFRINLPRFSALYLQLHLWFPPQFTSSTPPNISIDPTTPQLHLHLPQSPPPSQSTFGCLFNL